MSCEDCLSRREFLARSSLAVAGAASVAALAACGDGQFGPTAIVSTAKSVSLKVGSIPALATTGQLARIPQDGVYIDVKRTGPSTFLAFSTICTHEQCDTNINGNTIICPCHDTQYDSDGHVTKQPTGGGSATSLPVYATSYDPASDTLTIG